MKLTPAILTLAALSGLATLPLAGCASSEKQETKTSSRRQNLESEASAAIAAFKAADPSLATWFNTAAGYVVFPKVAKGGAIVGGAGGDGVVYKNGQVIGYSELSQGSVGLQLGGQVYRQVIFFESENALKNFKQGNLEFAGQASAVAVTSGGATNVPYKNGVAVFSHTDGGLMFEAGIGGQHFSFTPVN